MHPDAPAALLLSFEMPRGEVAVIKEGLALRRMWRELYRDALNCIFEESASREIVIGPDIAVALMEEEAAKAFVDRPPQSTGTRAFPSSTHMFRFDFDAYRREAHHYAVDKFYKTYFPRKRGAPRLPDSHLDWILAQRRKGLNDVAIAGKLGLRKDTAKYRVAVAEKRLRERVEELKRRYPQFVAPDLRGTGGERHAGKAQLKGQHRSTKRRK